MSNKITAISIFLVFVLALVLVVVGFMYASKHATEREGVVVEPQTEPISVTMSDLIKAREYRSAYELGVKELMSLEQLEESEILEISNLLITAEIAAGVEGEFGHQGNILMIYDRLFRFFRDEGRSDYFRAAAYAQTSRLFQQTGFDTSLFLEALKSAENGDLYTQYKEVEYLDTDEAIAYTALYDFNKTAEALYPDRFNVGWQAWTVGTSMLVNPPTSELEDEFISFMQKKLVEAAGHEYRTLDSQYQQIWLDEELVSLEWRLGDAYPGKFKARSTSELEEGFRSLLDRVTAMSPKTLSTYTGEYLVRIAYANFLFRNDGTSEQIESILAPISSGEFAGYAPSTARWIESKRYEGDDSDYLLKGLYELSLEYKTLKDQLIQFGWEY